MKINEIELRHLHCLTMLADELNFSRAAEHLHMSQPPLTRLVADVERALGAKLFERTTRQVSLTSVGAVFVAEARAVLARAEEALRTVAAAVERQAGLLRLAYTPLALQTVLPHLLTKFRAQDHDARIDLMELLGAAQSAALASGRIDLAFAHEPVKGEEYGNLLLHRQPLSLVVPETHPLAARASISLHEIGGEPLILHPRHEYPAYYDRIIAACEASGLSPAILERETGQNCLALAVGGAGLLLTPTSHDTFQTPGLRCVWVETTLPLYAEVWAAWAEKNPALRVKTLVEIIKTQFGETKG